MMDILSEKRKKEFPNSLTELLRLDLDKAPHTPYITFLNLFKNYKIYV
jgi:hypothetical protein